MSPEAAAERFGVSRETGTRLVGFVERLRRWNGAINLVSRASLADVWRRHVADSAQLLDLAPAGAKSWWDLGSGGGLPALVVAILAAERRPEIAVTAVESDARKCAFMTETARALAAPLTVRRRRIEDIGDPVADVLSARALAPLDVLLGHAGRLLRPGGVCLFPKGARAQDELTIAAAGWQYQVHIAPSTTDPDGAILRITEIRRAGPSP